MAVTIDASTVPCPEPDAATIDLAFHEVLHLVLTATTFHFNDSMAGTFISHDALGAVVATGRFSNKVSDQGPGFPREAFTAILTVRGTTVSGAPVFIRLRQHVTILPDGTPSSDFVTLSCS